MKLKLGLLFLALSFTLPHASFAKTNNRKIASAPEIDCSDSSDNVLTLTLTPPTPGHVSGFSGVVGDNTNPTTLQKVTGGIPNDVLTSLKAHKSTFLVLYPADGSTTRLPGKAGIVHFENAGTSATPITNAWLSDPTGMAYSMNCKLFDQ